MTELACWPGSCISEAPSQRQEEEWEGSLTEDLLPASSPQAAHLVCEDLCVCVSTAH